MYDIVHVAKNNLEIFILEVIHMAIFEILLWVVAIIFLIGFVMTLESRLSSKVGLFLICIASIFFIYYFSLLQNLAICVLFGVLFVMGIRFLARIFYK